MELHTEEFGTIQVRDVPVPESVRILSASYTNSGRVFLLYRTDDDPVGPDWFDIAVLDDDGGHFATIFRGRIPQRPTANGIRHMPMAGNSRVLLGDYVLECRPSLDDCHSAELLPVEYPWNLTDNPSVSHHWSEIIVSPDDHIAWTTLRADHSAVVAVGRLHRNGDRYVIHEPTIISSTDALAPDPDREGYFTASPMRGGEVKQFVHGGTAISAVGDGGGALTDSVVQDLASGDIARITQAPGYDETTIFSPDERLGLVMTSRASRGTDPAFLGLLPRPHANLVGMNLAYAVYVYTVSGVRQFRPGNIGPVLIDIERSSTEPGYRGVALNDQEGSWVYCSPMSWHPDSRTGMWMEILRGTGADGADPTMRIRVATLAGRAPTTPVPAQATPSGIPYGVTGDAARDLLSRTSTHITTGRIAGAHSGYVEFDRQLDGTHGPTSASSRYVDFSDDGRRFYNGSERALSSMHDGTTYEADLEMTGDETGEMRLRATWTALADGARLRFDVAPDGKPHTFGHACFGQTRRELSDLEP